MNLKAKPIRLVNWIEEDGLIKLKIKKFRSKFGILLCKIFKRPNYFFVNLDEIGSFVWKKMDGKNSIEDILFQIEEKFGKEKMKERLIIFIQTLKKCGYIELK